MCVRALGQEVNIFLIVNLSHKKKKVESGIMDHAYNSSTHEAETGGLVSLGLVWTE